MAERKTASVADASTPEQVIAEQAQAEQGIADPQTPPVDPIPEAAANAPQPLMTQADLALSREQDMNAARLKFDDEARANAGTVRMVCVSPFTLVDDQNPRGRVVALGEELDVSELDVQAYTGRMRPKGDPLEPDRLAGPVVSRG